MAMLLCDGLSVLSSSFRGCRFGDGGYGRGSNVAVVASSDSSDGVWSV